MDTWYVSHVIVSSLTSVPCGSYMTDMFSTPASDHCTEVFHFQVGCPRSMHDIGTRAASEKELYT